MFALFVAVTLLENLETFNSTVYMLNSNPIPGQIAVKKFLYVRQFAAARFLEGRQAERVNTRNSLVALVANEQNVIKEVNSALREQLKVMRRSGAFRDTDYLARLTVYYDLIFDCVAFLLAGVILGLFF